jgi:hypothetical protein
MRARSRIRAGEQANVRGVESDADPLSVTAVGYMLQLVTNDSTSTELEENKRRECFGDL